MAGTLLYFLVVWGDGIKCSMKGVDSIPFDDTKGMTEACHTSATKHADNNSKSIPNQYSILFKP